MASVGIAACGSSGESDEDKITSVIETSATSTDPADCKALETQNFMEQSEHSEGQEAVEKCEEDAEEGIGNPEEVEVSEVEVEGEGASANAAFIGGTADGQTLEASLVEEEGDWKLDEVTGFADFNREKLEAGLLTSLEAAGSELSSEQAGCIGEGIEELEDEEVEELILSLEFPPAFVEIVEECAAE
jgi:hypothetical protein